MYVCVCIFFPFHVKKSWKLQSFQHYELQVSDPARLHPYPSRNPVARRKGWALQHCTAGSKPKAISHFSMSRLKPLVARRVGEQGSRARGVAQGL